MYVQHNLLGSSQHVLPTRRGLIIVTELVVNLRGLVNFSFSYSWMGGIQTQICYC